MKSAGKWIALTLLCLGLAASPLTLPAMCAAEECGSCHTALAVSDSHAPALSGDCLACHRPVAPEHPSGREGNSHLREEAKELCLSCHPQVKEALTLAGARHAPLYRPASCLLCHAPHQSDQPHLLKSPEQELCLGCHGQDDFTRSRPLRNIAEELQDQFLHGPTAAGDCSACHQPHGSDYFRLLSAPYPSTFYAPHRYGSYAFCFGCHPESLLSPSADSTGFRKGQINLHHLHVVDRRKGRTCRACHAPHAAGNPHMVRNAGVPFGDWQIPLQVDFTPTGGSCLPGCHRKTGYDRSEPLPGSP